MKDRKSKEVEAEAMKEIELLEWTASAVEEGAALITHYSTNQWALSTIPSTINQTPSINQTIPFHSID